MKINFEAAAKKNLEDRTARVIDAVIRNAGNLFEKNGMPVSEASEAVKAYLSSQPMEIISAGVSPVLRAPKLEGENIVELSGLQFQLEKNPVEGKQPWVLWIHKPKSMTEKLTGFLGNRFPGAFTKEMIAEAFIDENFEAPISIAVSDTVKGIERAFSGEGVGQFLLQKPNKKGEYDTSQPLGYKKNKSYIFSIPGTQNGAYWVFKPGK